MLIYSPDIYLGNSYYCQYNLIRICADFLYVHTCKEYFLNPLWFYLYKLDRIYGLWVRSLLHLLSLFSLQWYGLFVYLYAHNLVIVRHNLHVELLYLFQHLYCVNGNEIDIISENSTFDSIDSFISNVIVKQIDSLPKDSYGLDKIKIQVRKYLSTKKYGVKKIQLNALCHRLNEGMTYLAQYAIILKDIIDLINRLRG
jgi:hypothetical protein